MFYIIPLIIIFPQFYWFSQLVEHRWFEDVDSLEKLDRELISGRPTLYSGLSGIIVRYSFFPVGDSYHLAHSLFPYMRWNYLKSTDKLLTTNIKNYNLYASEGFIFRKKYLPSALDYLKEKIIQA